MKRGWPIDEWFVSSLVSFSLYRREPKKCRLLLDCLETSYGHKEKVDPATLTIEHVMPQSIGNNEPGQSWQTALGHGWFATHQEWLHTLGNLTLTGYNTEMSNKSFETKQEALVASNLVLNRYFSSVDAWDGQAIQGRGKVLAKEVAALWPAPQPTQEVSTPSASRKKSSNFDFSNLRRHCMERISQHLSAELVEDTEARYTTENRELAVVCLASRPHDEPNGVTGYWYGFTPEQRTFLNEAKESYLALGCGSPDQLLLVPMEDAVRYCQVLCSENLL